MQVISAGWTLSPLQPEYTEGRPSHQCLVTLVLKLDLGGWLSSSSGSVMGSLLEPLMNTFLGTSIRNAFLQPLMLSVISLRDKVSLVPGSSGHSSMSVALSVSAWKLVLHVGENLTSCVLSKSNDAIAKLYARIEYSTHHEYFALHAHENNKLEDVLM